MLLPLENVNRKNIYYIFLFISFLKCKNIHIRMIFFLKMVNILFICKTFRVIKAFARVSTFSGKKNWKTKLDFESVSRHQIMLFRFDDFSFLAGISFQFRFDFRPLTSLLHWRFYDSKLVQLPPSRGNLNSRWVRVCPIHRQIF